MPFRFVRGRSMGLVLGASAALAFGVVACSSFGSQSGTDAGSEPLVDGATSPVDAGNPSPVDAAQLGDASQPTDAGPSDASDAATVDASEAGVPTRSFRFLYTLKPAARGAITSIAGADAACFAARPVGLTGVTAVKALLVGSTRTACTSPNCATNGLAEHLDWPLAPSTEYRRPDGTTVIGKTNAKGLFDTLDAAIGNSDDYVWTGLAPNGMGTGTNWTTSTYTCADWSSAVASQMGLAAYPGSTNMTIPFGAFADTCDKNYVFYCVESN